MSQNQITMKAKVRGAGRQLMLSTAYALTTVNGPLSGHTARAALDAVGKVLTTPSAVVTPATRALIMSLLENLAEELLP